MSPITLRFVIAFILFVHGVGHSMALFPAFGWSTVETWNTRSWLFSGLLGDTITRIIAIVLFSAALIGFVGAALGLLGWLLPHDFWRTLAIASSLISLIAIALFWNAFVAFFPNKAGAIAVDVAVLVGLLWVNWPAEANIGF